MVRATFAYAALALLSVTLVCAGGQARADFTVCNQTTSRIGVAIGHQLSGEWSTEGWWNLTPGSCESVLPGPLAGRFYYIFARDWDKGGDWGGDTPMCTQTKVFTIDGVENCRDRGFETSGFFEVDTGTDENWTVQLTDEGGT